MNRRALVAAFATLLALPAAASAQSMKMLDDPSWMPSIRITPFVGHLTAVDRTEIWQFRNHSQSDAVVSEMRIATGKTVGINADVSLYGPFGVSAAVAFGSRGETVFGVESTGDVLFLDGNNIFMARLGPSLILREDDTDLMLRRLNASVFAGGVVMHERPKNEFQTADFVDGGTSFGLNAGLSAELPFANDRLALQVGMEHNYMWWSASQSADIAHQYFIDRGALAQSASSADVDASHTWLLRAGLSFRFR